MSCKTTIKVALDWTPNTIHTGLFVALEKNFYAHDNLDVQLIPPDESYTNTPARLLERGEVDLVVCPSESCIAYHESGKMQLQAIYAILQKDASAIVSTKYSNFADLGDAKGVYGSYNAKYEDHIVRAMVSKAGGNGQDMQIKSSAGKLDLFSELKQDGVDATWIFLPWEGVEAALDDIKLHVFRTEDFGIPYGYSPVIARNASLENIPVEALKKFVAATRQGYEFAMKSVAESTEVLWKHCRPTRSKEFLERSQKSINDFYSGEDALGSMRVEKWRGWVEWLEEQQLTAKKGIEADYLFSNSFFE